ncbi:PAS domain-containing hybrid sensor histidine kinase/response regulator [Allorhodopirellula solitaria]|uniref:histidine kinase n=1 Tax=Allorhodopirellula solitaria TaxID=2527987 RepID=A0A5C5WZP3_9BACT|nr:PAS domain-containing hybrid sensor histidine kinase/response regulator [Allorhodopirellula solitaria]TWT56227.1 Aerobic respiration control sensor protein ArcB [Allorhodopirellula solitaria]
MSSPAISNDLAQLAIAMSGMGLVRIDCSAETAFLDDRAAALLGLPVDQRLPLRQFRERFHCQDRSRFDDQCAAALRKEVQHHFEHEYRVVHPNGDLFWLLVRCQHPSAEEGDDGAAESILLALLDITERKRLQDELGRAHETFYHLVEDNPLGLYVVDADLRMRYASQGARDVFQSVTPLIGCDFAELMHSIWPDSFASEAVHQFQRTLGTGEPYIAPPLVERRTDVDATEAYDWSIYRIALPDNQYGVVCYFYDATSRQMAEEAIRQRETYFREMTNTAPAMVWVTDVNHQCTFLSQGWCEYTGQNACDGLGFGWLDMVHPDDRPVAKAVVMPAFERHETFSFDYRLRTVSGEYRWAIDSGRPKFSESGEFEGYVGSVIDVHERHTAEKALRDRAHELEISEERLRLAAEATGFGTYDYDVETDETVWSDQLYRIFQQKPKAALQPSLVMRLIHDQDRPKVRKLIEDAKRSAGDESFQCEYRIIRPSGEIRWVLDSGRVIFQERRRVRSPVRIIGTLQDITQRKLHEVSLEQAKKSAESANRSRGEFLANMSHEIRTPMAAIIGHTDILKDHLTDPDNLQLVETIRRNGNFLLEIINDILDLSKIDAGKVEVANRIVRPDAILAEVRSLMDVRAAEKNLPLRIEFTGPIPETIHTDAIRLRQILVNLVGNAIKFTDEGEVRLRISHGSSGMLTFEVIDTGIGIAPDKIETLFDPFVQADNTSTRSFGGTGLGLTICRRLARILGGDIAVESILGVGSRFTLAMEARSPGQLVQPNLALDDAAEKPDTSIRLNVAVLVVDDRRDIRYLAQHCIEKAGGRVLTATNGREAIEVVTEGVSPQIGVIVMDMQMPVMDGYEVTAELRRRGCDVPIIALTANAMKSDRDKCMAAGCTDYTTKPLDRHQLVAMIDRLSHLGESNSLRSH